MYVGVKMSSRKLLLWELQYQVMLLLKALSSFIQLRIGYIYIIYRVARISLDSTTQVCISYIFMSLTIEDALVPFMEL